MHLSDEDLQAYLDEALPQEAVARLKAHLDGCAPCQSRLRAFRKLFSAIEDVPEIEAPLDLAAPVLAAIARRPRLGRAFRWALAAQVALGGAAAAIALGVAGASSVPGLIRPWVDLALAWPPLNVESLLVQAGRTFVGAALELQTLGRWAGGVLPFGQPALLWVGVLVAACLFGLAANGLLLARAARPPSNRQRPA